MQTLAEIKDYDLRWIEPTGESRQYALRTACDEIGSLEFEPGSELHAVGELNGQRWTFESHDSMRSYVVVRAEGEREPIATVAPRRRGGCFVGFRNGARYCWNTRHLWSTTWCFWRESEDASVCVIENALSKRGARVKVCTEASHLPETPVLVLLGWFLEILLNKRLGTTAKR